jgi:hypothetical protein
MGQAMWRDIGTTRVTGVSLLAGAAIVLSAAPTALAQPAITPTVKCEALAGLGFPCLCSKFEQAMESVCRRSVWPILHDHSTKALTAAAT